MTFATAFVLIVTLILAAVLVLIGYFVHQTRRIAREAERLVPPCGKFVEIDGNRIHYLEKGEGRPIIFVHGLGAQLYQFRHMLFDGLADEYRVIAFDRPGSGYSVRAKGSSARLPEQARVIHRFIETLGLERPLLVGHSLGGLVALVTAIEYPGAISGLVLLSPLTRYQNAIPPEFAPLYIRSPLRRWLMAQTVAIPRALKYAPQTLAFVFGPQEPQENYPVDGGGWLGLRPSHFYATVTDLIAIEHDLPTLEKRYGELQMPVGLLFGTADRVIDHRLHGLAMKERIVGLELEIVEGVGHMPHYAVTDRVAALIRRIAERAFADGQTSVAAQQSRRVF